jgi:hypothetical protein
VRECDVTKRVAERLKREGILSLHMRPGHEHGPDIEAQLPASRRLLFIEAKGNLKAPDAAIGVALYQILTRYDGEAACAIALPYTKKYEQLARNMLTGIQRLGVHLILVKEDDIWHLSPHAGGFFPSKPESLMEALDA